MATKKTNLKVAEPKTKSKTEWCVDEAGIKQLSKKIVDQALAPFALMYYINTFLNDFESAADVDRLRTAIDRNYAEVRKQYEASNFQNEELEVQLEGIEQSMMYYIGLEVGRRVRRD